MFKLDTKKLISFINSEPAFTDQLKNIMTDLPAANPRDPVAMAPHIRAMQEIIETAATNPDKFYYAVVVIGKDGKRPVMHGACHPALVALTGELFSDPELVNTVSEAIAAGMPTVGVWYEMATGQEVPADVVSEVEPAYSEDDAALDAVEAWLASGGQGFGMSAGQEDETEKHRHADDGCPHAGD